MTLPNTHAELRDKVYDILNGCLYAKVDEGQPYIDGQEEAYEAILALLHQNSLRSRIEEVERTIRGYHSVNHLMDERELRERIATLTKEVEESTHGAVYE